MLTEKINLIKYIYKLFIQSKMSIQASNKKHIQSLLITKYTKSIVMNPLIQNYLKTSFASYSKKESKMKIQGIFSIFIKT